MNKNQNGTKDDDVLLDRLVDGELTDEDYRRAVASLDEQPDGWRRCALAFLQAQALRRELGELATDARPPRQGAAIEPATAPRRLSTWPAAAALAASLLAFALGVGAAGFFRFERQDPTAGGNNTPRPHVAAAPSTPSAPPASPRHEALRPVSSVRLMLNDGDGEPTELGQLPVVEVNQNVEQYLADRQPALPAELIELLEHRGHTVERREQYIPMQLDDGRQLIVPVEGYRITPAEHVF